jgi:sterol desaturase/sphingolipid hydroxylase (fatty acid hydroxylase superfamily)
VVPWTTPAPVPVLHGGLSHWVRLTWAAHQAHHSSEYFNYSTALRQKWNLWFENLMWLPLPLLGMPPWMVYTGFSVNLVYQFFVHTEKVDKLPRPVELVFNTPSRHRGAPRQRRRAPGPQLRRHLIIWDRMSGTFAEETHRPTYGLTTPVRSYNLLTLQFGEYAAIVRDLRAARSWLDRGGHLFGPPGWRPADGA